jgi:hypothetical protein
MDELSQKMVKSRVIEARHPKNAQGGCLSRPEATLNREL